MYYTADEVNHVVGLIMEYPLFTQETLDKIHNIDKDILEETRSLYYKTQTNAIQRRRNARCNITQVTGFT